MTGGKSKVKLKFLCWMHQFAVKAFVGWGMALGGWQIQLPATTALNPRKDTGWPLETACRILNSQFYVTRTVHILTVKQEMLFTKCNSPQVLNFYMFRHRSVILSSLAEQRNAVFTYIPCILILSKFVYQLMHKWIVLKTILKLTLKLTLKQLQHYSV